MSLDSLLHFISSSGSRHETEADLAFAEVDVQGRITSINPFGRLAWGWRAGTQLDEDFLFSLEGLDTDRPEELPIKAGGLHLRGMRISNREGWFLIGYEPGQKSEQGQQVSFRSLMDRIPQPALSINTEGLARYVNEATARALETDASRLIGRPALSELICPEDRWKLAELLELAAREGSSHSSVRFGRLARSGVLHIVQSVTDEFQALILPLMGQSLDEAVPLVPEAVYQSFLEQAPVGIVHLDARGTVTFENHHFRTIVGSSPDESWLGLPMEGIRRLDATEVAVLSQAVRQGNDWSGQLTLRDGISGDVTHHLSVHASPIRHPETERIGTALMIEDRTELVEGRQEIAFLERSESVKSSLRELATEHSNPASFRSAATRLLGEQTGASTAILLGLSVVKERLVDVASWSSESGIETDLSISRETLAPFETSRFGQFLTPDHVHSLRLGNGRGEWWVDPFHDNDHFAGYLLLRWNPGERDGEWVTSARLNEWIRLFEYLYSSIQTAARYRMTVSAIDDALFGFAFLPDRGRRFHFVTEQIEVLTGYHPSELMHSDDRGVSWMHDVVHADDAPLVRAHHRTLQDGHESRVTYRIHHRDGSLRWLREHATPRTDATGLIGVNGILSDVSEQKAAELVLLQAKKEAEQSDRSKTAFIATMSHEIRTPLGAVNGFAQLLERELDEFEEELPYDLPDQVREFVGAISERSQKLLNLVHDLFELSNVEMGKATLNMSSQDLTRLVQKSVAKHRPEAEGKNLVLRSDPRLKRAVARVDERRFGQVMDNLLSNAIKFTEQGTIDVDLFTSGRDMVVEVRDSGIGISEDYLDQLFEPFSQEEDWRNRRFEGTGLGLALAGRLTEMMGGRIEAESAKGLGSTFRVMLPMQDDRESARPRGDSSAFPLGSMTPGGDGQS